MSHLKPMTQEEREAVAIAREQKKKYALNYLKTEYADENYWRELSSLFSCRLPVWWAPGSEIKYLRRASKKLNINLELFVESTGFSNVKQFAQANDKLTAFCLVGLLLEFHQDNILNNYTYREKDSE